MKAIISLFLISTFLISCSSKNEFQIKIFNKSGFEISEVNIELNNTKIVVGIIDINESFQSQKYFFDFDKTGINWKVNFLRANGNIEELFCVDVFSENFSRDLILIVEENNIDVEYNGICY